MYRATKYRPRPPMGMGDNTPPRDDPEDSNANGNGDKPPQDPIPEGRRCDFFYNAWDKFLEPEPKRAKQTSAAAKKVNRENAALAKGDGEGLRSKANAATSWEAASTECKAKVAAIAEECRRLNRKYCDIAFDLETNDFCLYNLKGEGPDVINAYPPSSAKRVTDIFDSPQFVIDGQSANDINQGLVGDCWFLAALMAVTAKKELIDNICVARDEPVGVYGFVFYRDGEWIYEVIDDKLLLVVGDDDDIDVVRGWDKEKKEGIYVSTDREKLREKLQKDGKAMYFSSCKSSETWLPLTEKAYAKAHGDYQSIEGGWVSEGIEDLTGGVAIALKAGDIMDKDRFWKEQLLHVNDRYLFGGISRTRATKGIVPNHAYAVLQAWEEGDIKLLKMRNPWGDYEWQGDWSDGSKLWTSEMMQKVGHTFGDDGVFWISYKDFLTHFPRINRVRLFNHEWQVSQQWTCVEVPWTVDFIDTKFQFTITEQCPVVIVLSQPDGRYFVGLEGRFEFALHFRIHPENNNGDHWIVRSMHNSGGDRENTRSVSAEIDDLPPGTYDVIFKIVSRRGTDTFTASEAVGKYAKKRKEKLLDVGRRFDVAHTKGNLRGMEETIRRRWREEDQDEGRSRLKKERKMAQKEKERARKRKKRLTDAKREAKKAKAQQKKEAKQLNEAKAAESEKNKKKDEGEKTEESKTASDEKVEEVDTASKTSSESKADVLTPSTDESTSSESDAAKAEPQTAADTTTAETTTTEIPTKSSETETEAAAAEASTKESTDAEPTTNLSEDLSTLVLTEDTPTPAAAAAVEQQAQSQTTTAPNDITGRNVRVVKISSTVRTTTFTEGKSTIVEKKTETRTVTSGDEADNDNDVGVDAVVNEEDEKNTDNDKGIDAATAARDSSTTMNEQGKDNDQTPETAGATADKEGGAQETEMVDDAAGPDGEEEEEEEEDDEEEDELDDDDFDWDSEIDGPVPIDFSNADEDNDDDDLDVNSQNDNEDNSGIFADDPWNAICVLGLRVYALGANAPKVRVVRKGEELKDE